MESANGELRRKAEKFQAALIGAGNVTWDLGPETYDLR